MSIVSYAVRTSLWAALMGKTLAGDRVYDSAVAPISEMLSSDPKPFLIISTDDEELSPSGWRIADAPRELDVVVEIAVGSVVDVEGSGYQLSLPHTDEGLETSLNMLGRQVFREIQVGGEDGWSDIFRSVAVRPSKIVVRRGAGVEGVRFAARQYIITCDTEPDPEFGLPPAGVWARLINAMREHETLESSANMVEAIIIGEPLTDWQSFQAELGLTTAGRRAFGLGPLFNVEAVYAATELTLGMDHQARVVTADTAP